MAVRGRSGQILDIYFRYILMGDHTIFPNGQTQSANTRMQLRMTLQCFVELGAWSVT